MSDEPTKLRDSGGLVAASVFSVMAVGFGIVGTASMAHWIISSVGFWHVWLTLAGWLLLVASGVQVALALRSRSTRVVRALIAGVVGTAGVAMVWACLVIERFLSYRPPAVRGLLVELRLQSRVIVPCALAFCAVVLVRRAQASTDTDRVAGGSSPSAHRGWWLRACGATSLGFAVLNVLVPYSTSWHRWYRAQWVSHWIPDALSGVAWCVVLLASATTLAIAARSEVAARTACLVTVIGATIGIVGVAVCVVDVGRATSVWSAALEVIVDLEDGSPELACLILSGFTWWRTRPDRPE